MANLKDLSKLSQVELRKALKGVAGGAGNGSTTLVGDVEPTVKGSEVNGDTYFDATNQNLYVFSVGSWIITGEFIWTKYAYDVTNLDANTGKVTLASDVVGFRNDSSALVKWIGTLGGQLVKTESNDPTVYNWSLHFPDLISDAFIDQGSTPIAVDSITLSNELYSTNRAGGIKSRVRLTWRNPLDENDETLKIDPTDTSEDADRYEPARSNVVFYKLTSDTEYTPLGEFTSESCIITDISPGSYDIRIIAVSRLGVESIATEATGQQVVGLQGQPSDVSGFDINPSNGQAVLSWNVPSANSDLDVLSGGSVQVRHTADQSANSTWSSSQVLIESLAGATTSTSVPLLIGRYFIKFIDSSGTESANAASILNTFAAAGFNFLDASPQEPTFSGTKTNCSVVDSVLTLTSGATVMTYDFATPIDLRTVQSTRIVPTFEGGSSGPGNRVCLISNICDHNLICRQDTKLIADFFMSTTDDDPSDSSAVWTAYNKIITRDVRARGMRFRFVVEAEPEAAVEVTKLGISIDVPDVVQTGGVVLTGTEIADTKVTFVNPFYAGQDGNTVPRIGLQIIDGLQGDFALVSSRTNVAFDVGVFAVVGTCTGGTAAGSNVKEQTCITGGGTWVRGTDMRIAASIDWQAIGA